ncbi:MAG: hypothetical protein HY718_18030 [Planctomycetes bacterium]|nr:hypothetical protein [Planctomycetota bacterium]
MNGLRLLCAAVMVMLVAGQNRDPGDRPDDRPRRVLAARSQPADLDLPDLGPLDADGPRPRRPPVAGDGGDGGPGPRGPQGPPGWRGGPGGPDRGIDGPLRGPGGMGRGPDGMGPDDRGAMIRPEEIAELLAFTEEHFPDVHDELVRRRQEGPRSLRQAVQRLGPSMKRLMLLMRENPREAEHVIRMQKLEMQLHRKRGRYQWARTDEERAAIREEMQRLLEQRFDLRIERLKVEIADLRQRLDEQTKRLEEQGQHKQQIIEDELARLFDPPRPRERGLWMRPEPPPDSQPAGDQVKDPPANP